jgi:hypothetical protein
MTAITVAPVLRTLVAGAVDYAGLFPPASLPMAEAVARYREYRRGADSWALGRFVVGTGRLAEFEAAFSAQAPVSARDAAWSLALLVGTAGDAARIAPFNARWADQLVIDAAEAKASTADEVRGLATAMPSGVALFIEVAVDGSLDACLDAVKSAGAAAKVRTGGVTADAFPPPDDVIRFIRGCHDRGVAFKATAGLHHPVRGTYRLTYAADSPSGTMYGYLNVLLAAAVIRGGGTDDEARLVLLADDGAALQVSGESVSWGAVHFPVSWLAGARAFVHGFGSCSYREPVDELTALPGAAP